MDAFQNLWVSTHNFLTRFNAHDTSPLLRQRHFFEEVLELIQVSTEACTLTWDLESGVTREFHELALQELLEEAADVIVTTQNLCMSHGLTLQDLESALVRVAQKNDMKTTETHEWRNGKITRK